MAVHPGPIPTPPGVDPDPFDTAVTDSDGTFILAGLLRRKVSIILSRPRYDSLIETIPADRDEAELTYHLKPDEKAWNSAARVEDEPVPPELRGRLTFVDLTPYGNNFLTDGPGGPGDGNHLGRVPRGVHKLGDTYFRIGEKLIQVKGRLSPNWPASVTGIKVAARGKRLHVLHACQQQAEPQADLGRYVIHYADGSHEKIPIVYGKHLVNWWHFGTFNNAPSDAKIAWTGTNNMSDQKRSENLEIRLYALTWINPHPDKEISTIDVVSAVSESDPFLTAVTLERP